MNTLDPKLTVLLFNERINARDLEGLVALMNDDYQLICYDSVDTVGIPRAREAWGSFFEEYPDYLNHFTRIDSRDDFVVIVGYSTCSNNDFLDGPALWSAVVRDDRISEWQVYMDTPGNRKRLNLE